MANIHTTGTVIGIQFVNVTFADSPNDYAKVTLQEAGAKTEQFIIWPGTWPSYQGAAAASSTQRLVWTSALALCRDAMTQKVPLTINHDEQSAIILALSVGTGPIPT